MTAIIGTGLTLLGQILVIPWLIIVSRLMPASETRDTVYRE
jgi:hypothetical protein